MKKSNKLLTLSLGLVLGLGALAACTNTTTPTTSVPAPTTSSQAPTSAPTSEPTSAPTSAPTTSEAPTTSVAPSTSAPTSEAPSTSEAPVVETRTIYAQIDADWTSVNAYAWDSSNKNNASWPGVAMEKVEGTENIWKIEIAETFANIIFNNGSGKQTADLVLKADLNAFVVAETLQVLDAKYENGVMTPEGTLPTGPEYISAIGSFGGANWDKDVEFASSDEGKTWAAQITFEAGNEWKIRMNHDWNQENWGFGALETYPDGAFSDNGGNIKVEKAGTYDITFSYETKKINVEAVFTFAESGTLLSIPEAIEYCEVALGDYTKGYYKVAGTVKSIENASKGNITLTDGTNDLVVYGSYGPDGKNSITDFKVGDVVCLSGKLGAYVKDGQEPSLQMKSGWLQTFDADYLLASVEKGAALEGPVSYYWLTASGEGLKRANSSAYALEIPKASKEGKASFTLPYKAEILLNYSSTGSSNTSSLAIYKEDGTLVASTHVVGTTPTEYKYTLEAGSYYLASTGENVEEGDGASGRGFRLYDFSYTKYVEPITGLGYNFESFAGTSVQYAANEVHELADGFSITITDCYISGGTLRLYKSDAGSNGTTSWEARTGKVVSNEFSSAIATVKFTVADKTGGFAFYGSTDGTNWTLVKQFDEVTKNTDYSVDYSAADYKYFKIEAVNAQARISAMEVVLK